MLLRIKNLIFENTTVRQAVAKNAFWLSIGRFGSQFIKAAITIYAARILGTSEYGILSYVLGFVGFFTIFADVGMSSILTREISQKPKEEDRYFSTLFRIKIGLLLFTTFLLIFVAPYFAKIKDVAVIIPFIALLVSFDGLRDFIVAYFRGKEKMELEAITMIGISIATVVFGFAALYISPTYQALIIAYILSSACGFLIAVFFLKKGLKKIIGNFSRDILPYVAKSAWPIAAGGIVSAFMVNVDIIMLGWWRTSSEVGLYSAAQKIVGLVYIAPGLISSAVFPLYSRLVHENETEKLKLLTSKVVVFLFLITIPIVIGSIIVGKDIISFIFGDEYASANIAFAVLMSSILVIYPFTILNVFVFAHDKHKSLFIYNIIASLSNVALNVLLIPYYGMIGAAVATVLSNSLYTLFVWRFAKKLNYFTVLPWLFKIIIAALIMGISTFFIAKLGVNVIINIISSGVIYFASLYLLKEEMVKEIKLFFPR
ncbi:MAG: flippase [Patescibacteria group bacterium]